MESLSSPYGGALVNLQVPADRIAELRAAASRLRSIKLSPRATCDLELLATGGFSPVDRFMGRDDYRHALNEMRLASGLLFPMPITLPVSNDDRVRLDEKIALRDARNELLAVMTVEEMYDWDPSGFAKNVLGTLDSRHPLVAELDGWGRTNISGRLEVIGLPPHTDFRPLRLTAAQTRARLLALGRSQVVAFETRNPLHRVHEELAKRAISLVNGTLLLHPVVGMTRPGDVDHFVRVRTYRAVVSRYFEAGRVLLALLPLAMRLAGPREALWHAIVRRNFGATHFIVGRDHASPGLDSTNRPFYGAYDAQELLYRYRAEIGIEPIPFDELGYLPDENRFEALSRVPAKTRVRSISGTEVRENYLERGLPLPEWLARPEVAEILADAHPPRRSQGFCIWLTGLSGSGKSTTAEALTVLLMERGRQVTVLDGDVVRTHLSAGLGFSKEDRNANVRRIGFVASEIVRHGGAVICAAVSPYRAARDDCRNMVGAGRFVEVFVDTPLEVCEQRDPKGLYAKVRRGEINDFTGIDDPYELPRNPEITLHTVHHSVEDNAQEILAWVVRMGFVVEDDGADRPAVSTAL